MTSLQRFLSILLLVSLIGYSNCAQPLQQLDDVFDAVKRDITDFADRFKESVTGSAIFEGLSKAINMTIEIRDIPERKVPRKNITVFHIIEKLTLKRLYKIMAANHQLLVAGYSHEIIYWIPKEIRSKSELGEIATLNDILPDNTLRILDLNNIHGVEKSFMGSEKCSDSKCHDLVAGKVHKIHMAEKNAKSSIKNTDDNGDKNSEMISENNSDKNGEIIPIGSKDSTYWLLDIDMNWVGDLGDILEALAPVPLGKSLFSHLLTGDESETDSSVSPIDFSGVCIGDSTRNNSIKSVLDNVYDNLKTDLDKFSADITQVFTDTVDLLTTQLLGNDNTIGNIGNIGKIGNILGNMREKREKNDKDEKDGIEKDEREFALNQQSFCWLQMAKFSGTFLDTLYNATFSSNRIKLKMRGADYWELADENNLKYSNFLDFGVKEGILYSDFIPKRRTLVSVERSIDEKGEKVEENKDQNKEQNRRNPSDIANIHTVQYDNDDSLSGKEFEAFKKLFLEEQSEPFVFERKAGTLFRKIEGTSDSVNS